MIASPQISQLAFRIANCACTKFEFSEFALTNKIQIDFDKYEFDFAITIDVKKDQNIVTVFINTTLSNLEGPKNIIALIVTLNEFQVNGLENFLTENNNITMIADALLIQLFTISLSSTRGIIAAKLEGSIYSNAIMPLLDASKLINPKPTPVVG